ncbi:MAG: alpha/beta hydrolase [Proteobacteria bacterium]|nr:alpha/beta hydrolase [Pseudomonadota bacterium]
MSGDVRRERLRLEERGGLEIALMDWGGDGPLALLHHANGFCAGTWGLVADGLRAHFHVVAMDARGHGDSSRPEGFESYQWGLLADDLLAVAEHLRARMGGERIALGLGHSFGGTLTLIAAGRRPDLNQRILLVDPVILPPAAVAAADPKRTGRNSELAERARKRRHVWANRDEARAFFAERELFQACLPAGLDLYVQEGLRDRPDGQVELKCPGEVEASIFGNNRSLDVFAEAAQVRVPTRLLRARRGNFPGPLYEALAEEIEDASIEDVDAGHLVPMERPDLVVAAALSFAGGA